MNGAAFLLLTASLGVDYGWEPAENGELVYIIQINDILLDELKNGIVLESEIHPAARGVRRFKIVAGDGELPRQQVEPPAELSKTPPAGQAQSAPLAKSTRAAAAQPARTLSAPPLERPATRPPVPDLLNQQPANDAPSDKSAAQADNSPPDASADSPVAKPPSTFELRNEPSDDAPPTRPRNSGFELGDRADGDASRSRDTQDLQAESRDLAAGARSRERATVSPGPPWSLDDSTFAPAVDAEIISREAGAAPPPLSPAPSGKPLANQQAGYVEQSSPNTPDDDESNLLPPQSAAPQAEAADGDAQRPWMPLMATMLLLAMSAALNGYLGWIARDFYRRYRELALDSRQPRPAT